MERSVVFICSPYAGDVNTNVERAKRFLLYAIEQGVTPIAPHLLYPQVLDDAEDDAREQGMQMGYDLLHRCDGVWVLGPTVSEGMQEEVVRALGSGMQVRYYRVLDDGSYGLEM